MPRQWMMLFIFSFVHCTLVTATKYYVSNSTGDDLVGRDGKSEASAWKTISKVNGMTFLPGDSILFKKGDVWRETLTIPSSGNEGAYIVFSSYGTGAKPKFLGSKQAITWSYQGGNIWSSATLLDDPYNIGTNDMNIWFEELDASINWGNVKKVYDIGLKNLTAEYDWTWNGNTIYVYAATDPDMRYASVEVPQRTQIIGLNSKQYIEINGIDLFYSLAGIREDFPTAGLNGLIVRNCHIGYLGVKNDGGYGTHFVYNNSLIEFDTIHDCGRRSVSLYNYGKYDISDIIVQNNMMYNGSHTTGVDVAPGSVSGSDGDINNITIRNNLIYDDENKGSIYSELIYISENKVGAGRLIGCRIYNNILKYTSMAAIHFYNVDVAEVYNNTFYETANITNAVHINIGISCVDIKIKNNIFYSNLNNDTNARGHAISLSTGVSPKNVDADYNVYYRINNTLRVISANSTNYYMNDIGIIRSDLGWEAHGQMIDPKFVSTSDYHLQVGSPAIGKGINVPVVKKDYDGKNYNNPPSIGAYEGNLETSPVPSDHVIILFPNPSNGNINVVREGSTLGPQIIRIFSMTGKIVFTDSFEIGVKNLEFQLNLNSGIYIVQVLSGKVTIAAQKLVIIK